MAIEDDELGPLTEDGAGRGLEAADGFAVTDVVVKPAVLSCGEFRADLPGLLLVLPLSLRSLAVERISEQHHHCVPVDEKG